METFNIALILGTLSGTIFNLFKHKIENKLKKQFIFKNDS